MALFCVLALLQVVVLIAFASVKNGSDEVSSAENVQGQLVKGAEAEINLTTRQSCNEIHEQHHHSQAETSCGREDEHPTACMLQNLPEEVTRYHEDTGNNTLNQILQQPDLSAVTTGRGVPEPAGDHIAIHINSALDGQRESGEEERRRETQAEEEMKSATKFSYFSTGISFAGIISIFSGYLGDQTGHAHTVPLKICAFFMTATSISGGSMLFLILFRLSSHISIRLFRSLKYTTLVLLALSMCSVSILFLKSFTILAFVPTLFIVLISFILAWHPCCHHQGNSGMPFSRLSESV